MIPKTNPDSVDFRISQHDFKWGYKLAGTSALFSELPNLGAEPGLTKCV